VISFKGRHHQQELAARLAQVGNRNQKGDNRNVILRSRSGKTQWRLPSSGVKSMLNNPFFEQLNQVNVADPDIWLRSFHMEL